MASSKSKFVFRMGQFSVKILKGEKLFHVRSVDCTGLHDGHAREFCSVPAMSFRFADSDILYFVGASAVWTLSKKPLFSDCDHITYMPKVTSAEFRWTQVALKCLHNMESISQTWSPHSSCDSRNLNLSPFCKLTSTSLAMWQQSILETYGNQTTTYIDGISGPMRLKFPYSMQERELITSLTEVLLC